MPVEVVLVIANSVLDYLSCKYCCYEIIGAKVSFLIYATKKMARFLSGMCGYQEFYAKNYQFLTYKSNILSLAVKKYSNKLDIFCSLISIFAVEPIIET